MQVAYPPTFRGWDPSQTTKRETIMTTNTKTTATKETKTKTPAKKVVANEFKKEWDEFLTEGKDAALALARFTSASAVATMATSSLVLDAGTTGAKLVTVGSRQARKALKEMDLDAAIASMF
jgi:hypothetical protein